jgi:hypothetical protein
LFPKLNICTKFACSFSAALALVALPLAGCASHPQSHAAQVVNRGEHLIGSRGRSPTPGNVSREHLLEIYNGQQKIIETMEARQRKKEAQKHGEPIDELDVAEGEAMPLSNDISSDQLLEILEKQQSLIQALRARSRN